MKPANPVFPYQVELFSRSLGLMNFPEEARITPIPVDEDLSSLSAILMDDDYYRFTIEHSLLEDDVHIANIESLICLKSKAFLDLSKRKANGESVDSKHIAKHKKDVFRLAAMLTPASRYVLPETLKTDIDSFCSAIMKEMPNADFIKSAGLGNVTSQQIIEQLKKSML